MTGTALRSEFTKVDWNFWREWVLLSALGYGFGGIAGWPAFNYFNCALGDPNIAVYLLIGGGGAVAGISVGLAQWRAVRLKSPDANKLAWLGGNVVGLAISWTLFYWIQFTLFESEPIILALLVSGVTWGLLAGLVQRRALQGQIQRGPLWFVISGLIGVVVFSIGWAWIPVVCFGYMSNSGSGVYGAAIIGTVLSMICWPLAGALAGAATGGLIKLTATS